MPLGTDRSLEVFGMPRERKQFALNRLLVDRRCKEHIHLSGAEIGHSSLQGGESGLAGLLGRDTRLHPQILAHHIDYIQLTGTGLRSRSHLLRRLALQPARLAIELRHLSRAIDYRRTQFEKTVVIEKFKNHLVADSVGISLCDSHTHTVGAHVGLAVFLLRRSFFRGIIFIIVVAHRFNFSVKLQKTCQLPKMICARSHS